MKRLEKTLDIGAIGDGDVDMDVVGSRQPFSGFSVRQGLSWSIRG